MPNVKLQHYIYKEKKTSVSNRSLYYEKVLYGGTKFPLRFQRAECYKPKGISSSEKGTPSCRALLLIGPAGVRRLSVRASLPDRSNKRRKHAMTLRFLGCLIRPLVRDTGRTRTESDTKYKTTVYFFFQSRSRFNCHDPGEGCDINYQSSEHSFL